MSLCIFGRYVMLDTLIIYDFLTDRAVDLLWKY